MCKIRELLRVFLSDSYLCFITVWLEMGVDQLTQAPAQILEPILKIGSEIRKNIPATSCTMPAPTQTKFHSTWHAAHTLLCAHIGEPVERKHVTVIFTGIRGRTVLTTSCMPCYKERTPHFSMSLLGNNILQPEQDLRLSRR